ncbi:DNA primase [Yoonia sp. R2331]|uniref:DNA primase n=1 Tax=Yoonia sp. R2331 TaxID=3237238 RepID=UPI0034E48AA9
MSLPPGFLDQLRDRLSLGQVVGRKVMWDNRKSNPGKGDLWAPCPFHQEKTASFHVDDRKGFYYCFGCHAKGDAISFVRETENVGFMEAVQILAGEAGLPMPERDPQAQQKADERTQLAQVMEQAVQHFRLNLNTAAAGEARDYLERRGLNADALARWDIGFAPAGWEGLRSALTAKGATVEDLLKVGLVKASDRGREPYDTFRDRIMFPIRDARGRAIAFGGRAMDPNDNAKYLNSPETTLFDKSRTLYNVQKAREAAGKGQPLVVAEGYMDVIALSEAGFEATVAPLGTAVTEHHLAMLWRIADEPIIALDGDTAGLRAAMRTIDIALPLLEAGKSLRFALMPDGMDPDDVLKSKGRGAMQKLLDGAIPMVKMLWERELETSPSDTPESKAGLERRLKEAIKKIPDPQVRHYYGQAIKQFIWEQFRPRNWAPNFQTGRTNKNKATASARRSLLARDLNVRQLEEVREKIVLAICKNHLEVARDFAPALEMAEFLGESHSQIALVIAEYCYANTEEQMLMEFGRQDLEASLTKIMNDRIVSIVPAVPDHADYELSRMTVAEQLALLEASRGHRKEIDEAEEEIGTTFDEHLTWRLARVAEAVDTTVKPEGKSDDGDFEVADNGAKLSKDDREHRDAIWANIKIEKSR